VAELENDISVMKAEHKAQESNNWSFISLLKMREFRNPLFIVCFLHAGQQLVGINAVSFMQLILQLRLFLSCIEKFEHLVKVEEILNYI
jgi:flavin reductase (DIM6/NTAB) family NADH-FMN oxidoreductase RutF